MDGSSSAMRRRSALAFMQVGGWAAGRAGAVEQNSLQKATVAQGTLIVLYLSAVYVRGRRRIVMIGSSALMVLSSWRPCPWRRRSWGCCRRRTRRWWRRCSARPLRWTTPCVAAVGWLACVAGREKGKGPCAGGAGWLGSANGAVLCVGAWHGACTTKQAC